VFDSGRYSGLPSFERPKAFRSVASTLDGRTRATLFVGPTLAFSPSGSWRLVVGGGPVLRTTSSTVAVGAVARRLRPQDFGAAGVVIAAAAADALDSL
jgi:hypothetical protein